MFERDPKALQPRNFDYSRVDPKSDEHLAVTRQSVGQEIPKLNFKSACRISPREIEENSTQTTATSIKRETNYEKWSWKICQRNTR